MLSARDRRAGAVSNVNKSTVRQGQQESSQSSFETCSPARVQEELRPFFSGTVLRRMWRQCSQSSLSRHRGFLVRLRVLMPDLRLSFYVFSSF